MLGNHMPYYSVFWLWTLQTVVRGSPWFLYAVLLDFIIQTFAHSFNPPNFDPSHLLSPSTSFDVFDRPYALVIVMYLKMRNDRKALSCFLTCPTYLSLFNFQPSYLGLETGRVRWDRYVRLSLGPVHTGLRLIIRMSHQASNFLVHQPGTSWVVQLKIKRIYWKLFNFGLKLNGHVRNFVPCRIELDLGQACTF